VSSEPTAGVIPRATVPGRIWVFLRNRVLPPGRSCLIALAVGTIWASTMAYLSAQGWSPGVGLYQYASLGVVVTGVLLTRDRFPRLTLLAVAALYPDFLSSYLATYWHVLPYLLAGYTAAARRVLPTPWVLLTLLAGLLRQVLASPWDDPQSWEIYNLVRYPDYYTMWSFNLSYKAIYASVIIATVLLGRASYQQRRANQELRQRQEEVERLRQVETDQLVAGERTRIARELHDVVAHHISAMVLRAQAADRVADAQPEQLRDAVRWIALDGQHTLAAMRQVVKVLRSADSAGALTPQTTLAEIPQIAARMEAVGLLVELRLPPVRPILPAAVELAVVRIIQESLTNALVHARAGNALVQLQGAGDDLLIEVHDDGGPAGEPSSGTSRWARRAATQPGGVPAIGGTGPMPVRRSSTFGSGHGLIGMRERATSCGGTLEIGRSHLGGWLVRARLSMAVPTGQDGQPTPGATPAATPTVFPQAG